jgi:hypothetical protein
LPGTMGSYTADVTIRRLFMKQIPGSAPTWSGGPQVGTAKYAVFFRIEVTVTEPVKGTTCENAAIYRHVLK